MLKVKGWKTGQVYFWLSRLPWEDSVPSGAWLSLAPPLRWRGSHRQFNAPFRMWQASPRSRSSQSSSQGLDHLQGLGGAATTHSEGNDSTTHTQWGTRTQGSAEGRAGAQPSDSDLHPLRGSSGWLVVLLCVRACVRVRACVCVCACVCKSETDTHICKADSYNQQNSTWSAGQVLFAPRSREAPFWGFIQPCWLELGHR